MASPPKKDSSPNRVPRSILIFLIWLGLLTFCLSLTGWMLQLLWLGPGRSQPWPWVAPTGLALKEFRRALLTLSLVDTLVAYLVYGMVAMRCGGMRWGRWSRRKCWISAAALLVLGSVLLEWLAVGKMGILGYRSQAPQLSTPMGTWAIFPILQRCLIPLALYRMAWRLVRW